jgi:Tfp pilus assembly pilus retraction ATPase PilT
MWATIWRKIKFGKFVKIEVMSVVEMKREIHYRVDYFEDEKLLTQVLEMLKSPSNYTKEIDATKYMEKLFAENDGLLKRLA